MSVMRVVVGWVASCHDLPLDRLDDIQLAVETLLAEEVDRGGEFSLAVWMGAGALNLRLDGLQNQAVKAALVTRDAFQPCEGCRLDVRLFLGALVDGYRVLESHTDSFAVDMQKRIS